MFPLTRSAKRKIDLKKSTKPISFSVSLSLAPITQHKNERHDLSLPIQNYQKAKLSFRHGPALLLCNTYFSCCGCKKHFLSRVLQYRS